MQTKIKRTLYFSLGLFFVVLAVAGALLPLLPTTPFLILAAYFFSHSSPKYHQWLLQNKYFGPTLSNWESFRCIPSFAKKLSFIMIIFFASSSMYIIPLLWVKLLTFLLISYALFFIYNIPNCTDEQLTKKVS